MQAALLLAVIALVSTLAITRLSPSPGHVAKPGDPSDAPSIPNHLAHNIVLIIRHAEKPASGPGLSPVGQARAQAYTSFFHPFADASPAIPPFTVDALFPVDALYADADSPRSARPRLTLEPLSRLLHLPIDSSIGTSDSAGLVRHLQREPHGARPLLCWRHRELPLLLRALGADPDLLLPEGKWPIEDFDSIALLTFDGKGRLATQQLLRPNLPLTPNTAT